MQLNVWRPCIMVSVAVVFISQPHYEYEEANPALTLAH
jgi:hypothetical protein